MLIERKLLSSPLSSPLSETTRQMRIRKNKEGKRNDESSIVQRVGVHDARHIACIHFELVQRARADDAAAWDQLYKMCGTKLYRPAFAVLRNRQDAEDAVQDCWLRAYANLKSFQGRSSFSTWLTRILINSALMIFRKKRSERAVSGHDFDKLDDDSQDFQLIDSSPTPEQIYAEKERKNLLNAAVAGLKPRLRRAVQMGQLRDRSMKEAARDMGVSLATVKSQVFHARAALRKSRVLSAIGHRESGLAA